MLTRRSIVTAFVLLACLGTLANVASAQQAQKLNIATGKMFEGPPLEWGETTCVGGTWLGYPMMCSPGTSRIMLRNATTQWSISGVAGPAAAYLPSGPANFGLNCNLDGMYQGDCWGTVEWPVADGTWVGAWSGKFDLANYVAKVSITAHGTGALDGRELKIDAFGPATDADFYLLAEIVNRREPQHPGIAVERRR